MQQCTAECLETAIRFLSVFWFWRVRSRLTTTRYLTYCPCVRACVRFVCVSVRACILLLVVCSVWGGGHRFLLAVVCGASSSDTVGAPQKVRRRGFIRPPGGTNTQSERHTSNQESCVVGVFRSHPESSGGIRSCPKSS